MTTSSMSTPTTTTNDTVIGGVDTHADDHVAAAITSTGGVLGTQSLPTTVATPYRQPLAWLQSFGSLDRVGVEGTGSYGAALARHLTRAKRHRGGGRAAQPPAPPSPGQDRCCRCHPCRASWALR